MPPRVHYKKPARRIPAAGGYCLYYCFPKAVDGRIPPVAKARLATEELYKLAMADRRRPSGDK